jgi:tRNA 2-thiouridine synthesizing protein C
VSSHFFLCGEAVTHERLSWIGESLKYFFITMSPETLRHPTRGGMPVFTFFLTGDALYSLFDRELLQLWEITLSLPSIRIVCDQQELLLRGLSIEPLKMKYPGLITSLPEKSDNNTRSFWGEVTATAREHAPGAQILGYLQMKSPYMHDTCAYALRYLDAALESGCSPELYAFLDGVHVAHSGQRPSDFKNIGEGLAQLSDHAAKKNIPCTIIASARCATERGYGTWDDGKGVVISGCTLRQAKLRSLREIIERFFHQHVILGETGASIGMPGDHSAGTDSRPHKDHPPPPLVVMVTHTPYGTEMMLGALSFAIACAYRGILTRIIFIEDGVFALSGDHKVNPVDQFFNMQDLIDSAAWSEKLQLFAFQPSLHKRGITKNKKLNAVLEIGTGDLGRILFNHPHEADSGHQRIVFF